MDKLPIIIIVIVCTLQTTEGTPLNLSDLHIEPGDDLNLSKVLQQLKNKYVTKSQMVTIPNRVTLQSVPPNEEKISEPMHQYYYYPKGLEYQPGSSNKEFSGISFSGNNYYDPYKYFGNFPEFKPKYEYRKINYKPDYTRNTYEYKRPEPHEYNPYSYSTEYTYIPPKIDGEQQTGHIAPPKPESSKTSYHKSDDTPVKAADSKTAFNQTTDSKTSQKASDQSSKVSLTSKSEDTDETKSKPDITEPDGTKSESTPELVIIEKTEESQPDLQITDSKSAQESSNVSLTKAEATNTNSTILNKKKNKKTKKRKGRKRTKGKGSEKEIREKNEDEEDTTGANADEEGDTTRESEEYVADEDEDVKNVKKISNPDLRANNSTKKDIIYDDNPYVSEEVDDMKAVQRSKTEKTEESTYTNDMVEYEVFRQNKLKVSDPFRCFSCKNCKSVDLYTPTCNTTKGCVKMISVTMDDHSIDFFCIEEKVSKDTEFNCNKRSNVVTSLTCLYCYYDKCNTNKLVSTGERANLAQMFRSSGVYNKNTVLQLLSMYVITIKTAGYFS